MKNYGFVVHGHRLRYRKRDTVHSRTVLKVGIMKLYIVLSVNKTITLIQHQ